MTHYQAVLPAQRQPHYARMWAPLMEILSSLSFSSFSPLSPLFLVCALLVLYEYSKFVNNEKHSILDIAVNFLIASKQSWTKVLSILGLISTILLTPLLSWTFKSTWTRSRFYDIVTNNRATSQIFDQIFSQGLDAVQILAVFSLINFLTSMRLANPSTTLDIINF